MVTNSMVPSLTLLTDGNYLCNTCGCIVHGADTAKDNHLMWHKLLYNMYKFMVNEPIT